MVKTKDIQVWLLWEVVPPQKKKKKLSQKDVCKQANKEAKIVSVTANKKGFWKHRNTQSENVGLPRDFQTRNWPNETRELRWKGL